MEDILGIAILIIYFFAAASGKKKKAKKQQSRGQRRRQRAAEFAQVFEAQEPVARADICVPDKAACKESRMHLHQVSQDAFARSGEGEDPCHAGGEPAEEAHDDAFGMEEMDDAQRGYAQDVLRGVIMSEILTRPCDRAALRRNRRSAV